MKSYKSFDEIGNNYIQIINFFESKSEYLAHTHKNKKFESLHEHINKVKDYFLLLVKIHDIEKIIDRNISEISFENEKIGNLIKEMFFQAIIFHDFGKTNDNFQTERMKNNLFKTDNSIKIGYEHSFLSAYIFLNYFIDKISLSELTIIERNILYVFSFYFSIPILKHHSGFIEKDYNFENEKIESLNRFLEIYNLKLTKQQIAKLIALEKSNAEQNLWTVFNNEIKKGGFDFFTLFALLKLNYSLLTASDYYATSQYMNDLEFKTDEDFGLITEKLKNEIIINFENTKKYNKDLIEKTDYYLNYPNTNLQIPNNDNLNILRQKLGAEVLSGIENNKLDKVFYIEAPTGGGKTNMSMIAIYKMLKLFPEINKVFYVFPFTTLITQTDKAIKETLGLTNLEVTQVHSKAGFQTKTNDNEEDAKYGNQFKNQIDNLFVNYPFTLLTHIKFFDVLKSNKKDTNYLLHRLANSIVVIDELQAYSPEHWDKLKYYISNYAKLFNIRFIIMSATLPKISNIAISNEEIINFQPLIGNAQEDYLLNPNFCGRVNIKTDLLNNKDIDLPYLANFVFKKSEEYSKTRNDKYKGSVYTIIEFIFKKSATEFYDLIIENKLFKEYKKFVLSGTIIEPRRKEIINFLKDENNRTNKVLLITTQVVEAGVDIDMDLGFKNQSLIDSDEQLAGRINRNINKENCELYLFRINEPKTIYGKDLRYKIAQELNKEEVKRILQEKDFETLYKKVMQVIDKDNNSAYKVGFNEYKDYFKSLNFEEIQNKFRLIENENATIFIPFDIDILNYQFENKETKEITIENNFSPSELDFIQKNNCIIFENKVSGEKIWEIYTSIIQNKNLDFTLKNNQLKVLNGIMSKFVFSVFMKKANDLKKYCKYNENTGDFVNYNYYKFEKEYIGKGNIYDFYSGINEKLLEKELNQTFEFI